MSMAPGLAYSSGRAATGPICHEVIELFPALQAFRASGNLHGEIVASRVMIGESSWNMNGELTIT